MFNKAVIIGGRGQDGKLLSDYLASLDYEVIHVNNQLNTNSKIHEHVGWDLLSSSSMLSLFKSVRSCEVYYLAAYHHSSEQDSTQYGLSLAFERSFSVHVSGLINVLNAIEQTGCSARIFYASSSLIYSGFHGEECDEETPIEPIGPYGISKAAGGLVVNEYRLKNGVFASTGILFNHESGLRAPHFLTARVIESAYRIYAGSKEKLIVGDLNAKVDWGYAPDYVKAFHGILQLQVPDDFVVGTGALHSVSDFARHVFSYFGLEWQEHVIERPSVLHRKQPARRANPKKLQEKTGICLRRPFSEFVQLLVKDTMTKRGYKMGREL